MTDTFDINKTYQVILKAAREGKFTSYTDLAEASGVEDAWFHKVGPHLDELLDIAFEQGWPMITAIVVQKNNKITGHLDGKALEGIIKSANKYGHTDISDEQGFVKEQQNKTFNWSATAPKSLSGVEKSGDESGEQIGPRFVRLFGPALDVLRESGGTLKFSELKKKVKATDAVSKEDAGRTTRKGRSQYENQIGWARFYLHKAGLIYSTKYGVWNLTDEGRETYLDYEDALKVFRSVREEFYGPSDDDEIIDVPPAEDEPIVDLFSDPDRQFWFVGALWSGTDDQTERFLSEGIWQNGYHDRFTEHVARIKPGDRIAIKSTFVQKNNLPFDNKNRFTSVMRIKVLGTVTEGTKDGRTVKVKWHKPLDPQKSWYFYTYRYAIAQADPSDDHARRLIQFTFGNRKQDYDYWLRVPYFAKRYGSLDVDDGPLVAEKVVSGFKFYGTKDIIEEGCFLDEKNLEHALSRLRKKKNLILQGPPGTGKTWLAKKLAYALIETRNAQHVRDKIRIIQFHPTLSYEDFIRGWRPSTGGNLSLVDGSFLRAVNAARAEPDEVFVFIIEEINRGNPAQIFGEMLTLLEDNKRKASESIEIAYKDPENDTDDRVYIPSNLYIIGTMNIADRSLALVDLALRRRFAFMSLEPELNDAWIKWCRDHTKFSPGDLKKIQTIMENLNGQIESDSSLGPQYKIGHSYVTPASDINEKDWKKWLSNIIRSEIGPLLEEYWYDSPNKANECVERLLNDIGK